MRKKWWLLLPLLLLLIYFLGPHPAKPVYSKTMPVVPDSPAILEAYIAHKEAQHHLKPDNEARIVWYNDSMKNKTEYAIVYLHGFSASQAEGDPVHRDMAKKFGCNLYLSRLAEHGIDTTEPLMKLTADNYWESAKEALAIGHRLGKKVILMSTSTGGTLALQLAADYPDQVDALLLMSPNIAINDKNAWLLNNPWGLQIARMVVGSHYIDSKDTGRLYRQYWNYHYRIEAAVALEELIETSMTKKIFEKVTRPTLLLYYYKDPVHQDSTVKVSAELDMFKSIGTPAREKRAVAIPGAGNHVLGSYIRSHAVPRVEEVTEKFMKEVLHLQER